MNENEIKQALTSQLNFDKLIVTGDGRNFQIIAISDIFNGMNKIKRQQLIYAPIMKYITDNKIHALSIKTYTNAEWKSQELKSF